MDGENTNDAGQICLSCSSRFCPKLYIFPLRALQTLLRREEADDADDEACPKALGGPKALCTDSLDPNEFGLSLKTLNEIMRFKRRKKIL